jgi:hypothetical protein
MHKRRLPLAYSCPQSLDGMLRRSESERWCSVCDKRVHELSAMRESEARALLRASKTQRTCISYQVDAAGQVLFRDRLRAGGRSTLALAGLALAVTLGVGCVGFEYEEVTRPEEVAEAYWADSSIIPSTDPDALVESTPGPARPGSTPEVVDVAPGQLMIMVVDTSAGESPIAGASIKISSDAVELAGPTGEQGTRLFEDLQPGSYAVEVTAGAAEQDIWIRVHAGVRATFVFQLDPDPDPAVESEEPRIYLGWV